jgi:hypothetical protein
MERLGEWAEHSSSEDLELVDEALMCVVEGTWPDRYDCHKDVVHRLTWHILVRAGLIVTVRFADEYPTMVQLIHVGPP